MEVKQNIKLNPLIISEHFTQLGDEFMGNLKKTVDIEHYAAKLSKLSIMNAVFDDQDLVGLIAYYQNFEKNEIFISHVGVIPVWQNKGLASKLIKSVTCEASGFRTQIEVFEENLVARRFYETLNFKVSAIVGSKLTLERFS